MQRRVNWTKVLRVTDADDDGGDENCDDGDEGGDCIGDCAPWCLHPQSHCCLQKPSASPSCQSHH